MIAGEDVRAAVHCSHCNSPACLQCMMNHLQAGYTKCPFCNLSFVNVKESWAKAHLDKLMYDDSDPRSRASMARYVITSIAEQVWTPVIDTSRIQSPAIAIEDSDPGDKSISAASIDFSRDFA